MAKYCTKCGKKLEDGKPCDCEVSKKETKKEEVREEATGSFDFNECVNSYVAITKGMFTKPVDTLKKYAKEKHFTVGMISIIINSIISAFFAYCFSTKAIGLIGGFLGYGSLFSSSITVPFAETFFQSLLSSFLGFAVTALMIYVIAGALMKDKITVKKAFALVGVCATFTSITTLVCILFTYISLQFMLIILLIASIFYLTYLYQGIVETTEVDRNKVAYVFVIAIAVCAFVTVYILPKLFS